MLWKASESNSKSKIRNGSSEFKSDEPRFNGSMYFRYYAKNPVMMETISSPMRFWASEVEAPTWGVLDNARMRIKSYVLRGFFRKNVKARAANLAAVESFEQVGFVTLLPREGIDDDNAILHFGDGLFADHGGLAGQGRGMERDEIGRSEELIHFNVLHILVLQLGYLVNIIRKNLHAERLAAAAKSLTDAAVTDNADGFAGHFDAFIRVLFPTFLHAW